MWLEPGARVRLVVVAILALACGCRPPGYGKEPPPDASEVDAAIQIGDAASDATMLVCDHEFRLDGRATASSVWLTGSMVGWGGDPAHGAIAFTLGTDGGWTGSYLFQPGTHQYKFIVNGNEWIVDPTNPDQVDDGFGGKNSVYTCVP
jgi:hypothetical protein